MPEPGSAVAFKLFIIDAVITLLFTCELMLTIFVHSNNYCRPFLTRPAHWFETFIVLVSLANVVLPLMGKELPNAKLLRSCALAAWYD